MPGAGKSNFPSLSLWLRAALFGAAYFACAQVGSFLTIERASYVIFWLPAGLYVAALLIADRRHWPALVIAATAANFSFDLFHGLRPQMSIFFCVANAVQAVAGAWLIRRFAGDSISLASVNELLCLAGFAAGASAMIGGLIGAAALVGFGLSQSLPTSFGICWGSSGMAVLVFSPFLLAWFGKASSRISFRWGKALEAAALVAGLAFTIWKTVGEHGISSPNKNVVVAFLLWAGLRFGVRGATLAQFVLALSTAFLTTHFARGLSPEAVSTGSYVLDLQLFVVVTSLAGVIPAIVIAERDLTLAKLRESEEHFRNLTQAAFEGIAISEDGRLINANEQCLKMFGYDRRELMGMHLLDLVAPESRALVVEALKTGGEFIYGHRLLRRDGTTFPAETRAKTVTVNGRTLRMTALRDVTERRETEHLIQTQRDVLEMMTLGRPLSETLNLLLQRIESQSSDMLCSILLLDSDGMHVRHGAAPSLPPEYLKAIDGREIGPYAGSCGTAAYRRERVFVENIETDPLWNDYRAPALAHGLRACWSTPIFDAQRNVLGTFAIYYRRTGLPEKKHLRLIETATHTAAVCIIKHQTDEALRKSQEKFSMAFRCSPDAMALAELDSGRCIELNEGFERLFGYSRDEIIGRTALEMGFYRNPEDRKRVVALLQKNGKIYDLKLSGAHRDGHEIIVLYNSERIELDGRACMLTVLHDITEQVRAEEALRVSEEKFSKAFRTSPASISITELDSARYVDVNDAFCQCYGYSRDELIGRTSIETGIWTEAERHRYVELLRHYGTVRDYELNTKTRDGRPVIVLLNSEVLELNGRTCIIAAGHDITERKRAEADRLRARENFTRQLIASQEAERKRIAGELHDSLGQNLLLIKNRVQQMIAAASARSQLELEPINRLASEAITEVRHISQDLHPYQLDQLGLTRAIEVLLNNAAQSTGLVIERRLENADDVFAGEAATNLYRIVQEALNNIVKHAAAKRVSVQLERDIRHARLWIKDDGRGFYLNDRGDFASNGLGLRNIAERARILGGSLKLHSAPGQGTSLEVIVPVAP